MRVRDLFEMAGVQHEATHVLEHAEHGYTTNVPLADITTDEAIVAYAFEGEDIEPGDIGSSAQPYATAGIRTDISGFATYALRLLKAGDYTVAVTCNGDDDDPATDDDVTFRGSANVSVDEGEVLTRNLTN